MRIHKSNITAVILAGGKGSRLGGQDKGLVIYKGKPLIAHVLERIQPQVEQILISANRNQSKYQKYGYTVINDELSNFQGPLAGFASAMKIAKTDYILTLPCDGPKLPLDLVSRMTQEIKEKSGIAVAHNGERLQPVYAMIPVALLDSLENFLANGHRKVESWYAEQKSHVVDFSEQSNAFFNINRKQDL